MMQVARWLVVIVAAGTAVGAPYADYFSPLGKQHIRNPRWPPHAKFHNGQSIVMGMFQGILALAILFGSDRLTPAKLIVAALVSASYWVAAFGARLFPGTAWTDPEFEAITPKPLGFHIQQLLGSVLLVILATSIGLALMAGTNLSY